MNNRENSKNWNKESREKYRNKFAIITCPHCGKVLNTAKSLISPQAKFCSGCNLIKVINQFRSKGKTRYGTPVFQKICRECEKKERWEKSPKRKRFL